MKKVLVMVALVMVSVIVYAFNDSGESNQGKKEVTGNGEVVVMDKDMFLKDVFDYEKSKEWKYKGDKPAIIDLYADWCGPCRQQIPYLKKLEEEMHGTDVVFGGVSVDESKDKQKWLDFIKTEGLKGVQLLAGGWSKITKDYKITGIPRFMVFDKKGNIVSVDVPRPSSPELKKMLENELKK